ncbi:MAG TPA: GNAT family N-acetyltransferase [Acidisphaera sp.]|nr:GNAT family N-acetyltransferase [Acidisphaera sp.]
MTAVVRASTDADIEAIADIYAHHVLHGLGSFETEPPNADEMRRRRADIIGRGLPYLVAEDASGAVLGYAYAGPYRTRAAYLHTVENSVYLRPEAMRRGIGFALLTALIAACERCGCRQMVAVVGDSGNAASIALHLRAGFRLVGTLESVGFKHGRWVDTVLLQRAIGAGAGPL